MSDPRDTGVGRREFVGVAAAAAGITILKPSLVFGTQANSAVRLGLLGCGGRGRNVMGSFLENTGAVLTAIGDLFPDNLDAGKTELDAVSAKLGKPAVDPSRTFKGLKAYEALFASKDVDAVYIASPPVLPPRAPRGRDRRGQARLPREAGGRWTCRACKKVMALGEKARAKKLSLAVGFQIRHASPYVELAKRIHEGQIGSAVSGQIHYFASAINRPDWPDRLPRRAAPAQLGPRQGALRRHHRGAERPHHRRHQLAPEGPPGEGGGLGRPRGPDRPGRRLEPLQLRLHLPGRRPHQLRLHPVRHGGVGRGDAVLRHQGHARRPATTRPSGSPARPAGSSPASGGPRPPTRRPRSPAPSGAPSRTPTPTSRRPSSRASRAATSSTRPSRARSRRSPASSAAMAAYTGKEVTWDQMMKSKEVWDPKMDWKAF